MRQSGILMPVSALPGAYGIGSFSKEAYKFVDWLQKSGQSLWQILPLGPTSYGDSPYQSFSTFAGNPYFIDLETLAREGLLEDDICRQADFGNNPNQIDYGMLYQNRFHILKVAYEHAKEQQIMNSSDYVDFLNEQNEWLSDYALYMSVKDYLAGIYGRKISVFADQMQFRIIRTYLQMKFIFISFYNTNSTNNGTC